MRARRFGRAYAFVISVEIIVKELYSEDRSSMFLPDVDTQLLEHGVITQKTILRKLSELLSLTKCCASRV
jgi:hypothetical protein